MMGNVFYFPWEPWLIAMIQQRIGRFGEAAAEIFSAFGEEIVLILILGFLYWCYDKRFGRYVGISILAGICINPMIKCIALRLRPYMVHTDTIKCLRPVAPEADVFNVSAQGYSFPSGHSMNAAIVYGAIPRYLQDKEGHAAAWLKVCAAVLVLLVGISRIMLGNHYPTDVLAGWAIGGLLVFVSSKLQRIQHHEWQLWTGTAVICGAGLLYCRTEDYFTAYGLLLGFVIAMPFEQRFVNFASTRKLARVVLRLAGGLAVYVVVNTLLKMPFSSEFLSSGTLAALLVRMLRYVVVSFAMLGVYPMLFGKGGDLENE